MTDPKRLGRRTFLGRSAAAIGALPWAVRTRASAPSDELRFGLIGAGGRGSALLRAAREVPGARVVALCDVHEGRLAAAARTVEDHRPATFADHRGLLELDGLDAVLIATPCDLHAQMAVDALGAGIHCYCEKPLALSVEDLDRIAEAADRSDAVIQVGQQLRYGHPWITAAKAIRDGAIGEPALIRAHRYNTDDIPAEKAWFFERKRSGDIICEQAVHEFDLFNWAFDALPGRAAGFGGRSVLDDPPRDIMDHYTLTLEYPGGRRVSYSHCWFASPADPGRGRQTIVLGTEGSIDLDRGLRFGRDAREPEPLAGPRDDSTAAAVSAFLGCVRDGTTPEVGVEIGRNAVLVALLGLKAIDEGRVVTMDEVLRGGSIV